MEEANQSDIPAYSSPKETSDLLSVYHFCEDATIAPTVFLHFLGGWIGFGVAAEELSSSRYSQSRCGCTRRPRLALDPAGDVGPVQRPPSAGGSLRACWSYACCSGERRNVLPGLPWRRSPRSWGPSSWQRWARVRIHGRQVPGDESNLSGHLAPPRAAK